MSLAFKLAVVPFSDHKIRSSRKVCTSNTYPTATRRIITASCSLKTSTSFQESIGKVRERIKGKVEISPSAYDTAWVAMVPSREYSGGMPCFPRCLDWIMENQNSDGSWGLNPGHPSLVKDSLSCTLACLIALRKWNVGQHQVQKGIEFIKSNAWAANDKDQFSPIGFDIVFPMMISYAIELDLTLPLDQDLVDSMFRHRDTEIKRRSQNLEYVAEGLGESFDWNKVLTQKRSNGSLFNSPATTAAALIHCHDDKCSDYLHSALKTYKTWVPTIYPTDIYTRLCVVAALESLGVHCHFRLDLDSILEETYGLWKQKDEELFSDVTCLAMAFRLLRMKGYQVSSDELSTYVDQEVFFKTASLQMTSVTTVLELYRASQIKIYEDESVLEKIHAWTSNFLKQQLLNRTILDKQLRKQVEYDLKNFHGKLNGVVNRRSLELYDINHYQILKAAYRCPTIHNEDFLVFSRSYFNICQAQYQKELQQLERWYTDCRLDSLKYGRSVLRVSHFLTSAILCDPELSDARIAFVKQIVLITRLDDFFDHHGSREESLEIIELVKKWNEPSATTYGSEEVKILFTALYTTINELAAKAYIQQGRRVKHVLIDVWVEILTSAMRELDSCSDDTAPTMDEYLSFAGPSIGSRVCILISIHFLGIKLSEEIVLGTECGSMTWHVSLVNRLLNDIQTYKKEQQERKLNSVSLQQLAARKDESVVSFSDDDAIVKIQQMIEYNRRKLLQMVVQTDGSAVPRECKDVFWNACKMSYYLYSRADEFTSPQEIMEDMKSLIYEPLNLPPLAS
ncbi:hypothetical protein BUALT_Bualt10G0096800 [Buddleja alternifolia]|uniref:Uncharacterized protein n=1 Tax=Buddleja alternifolia TaxID=168488 RepID=A0AAV6X4P5_9LAMI|nr:hypothetical protein BUALT_Bualt10G0096800 [Buddleja alternifolia]